MDKEFPKELTPVNIKAFFYNHFGACGCSELEDMIETIKDLLIWHKNREDRVNYDKLYGGNLGIFYLLAGMIDYAGLAEHGGSIRYPWLSPDGEDFLNALQKYSAEEIEEASGTAYDGLRYGN